MRNLNRLRKSVGAAARPIVPPRLRNTYFRKLLGLNSRIGDGEARQPRLHSV